jgi:putative ABC transport system substrate-binding protein
MTGRRAVLRVLVIGGLTAAARMAMAQRPLKAPRIGALWFASSSDPSPRKHFALFRQRLRELGYIEGKTLFIDERFAEGKVQLLNEFAREFVDAKVDIIVAPAVAAATAARRATDTIPIVMLHAGNPIGAGLIVSLARPGGNVTGTANPILPGKRLELMRELVPHMTRLAVLINPTNAGASSFVAGMNDAARSFNISVAVVEVTRTEDFPEAFMSIRGARPDWLHAAEEPMISAHRAKLVDFAASARLPLSSDVAETTRVGGLVSYAPPFAEHYVLAATYVDKILKGAKPAELPVEEPTRYELILNLKTAKSLGLSLPQSVLVSAAELIGP